MVFVFDAIFFHLCKANATKIPHNCHMKTVKSFADIRNRFENIEHKPTIAVACPSDAHTREVVELCLTQSLATFMLFEETSSTTEWAISLRNHYPDKVTIHNCQGYDSAAQHAVAAVRAGDAGVLMKGAINTDNLLRAVLDKQVGLLPPGHVLSHLTAAEIPSYSKLLFFSDAAVIPSPDLKQFEAIIRADVAVIDKLNIAPINIALIHFTEKINPRFPFTLDYKYLMDNQRNLFGESVVVGGPMDVKTACDSHSGLIKKIDSPVGGHADILIFPNLVAANTFYKTISCFADARMAGMITGASAPIVIPSRADSTESKFFSLALACIVAEQS